MKYTDTSDSRDSQISTKQGSHNKLQPNDRQRQEIFFMRKKETGSLPANYLLTIVLSNGFVVRDVRVRVRSCSDFDDIINDFTPMWHIVGKGIK